MWHFKEMATLESFQTQIIEFQRSCTIDWPFPVLSSVQKVLSSMPFDACWRDIIGTGTVTWIRGLSYRFDMVILNLKWGPSIRMILLSTQNLRQPFLGTSLVCFIDFKQVQSNKIVVSLFKTSFSPWTYLTSHKFLVRQVPLGILGHRVEARRMKLNILQCTVLGKV